MNIFKMREFFEFYFYFAITFLTCKFFAPGYNPDNSVANIGKTLLH